jgi:hypothetical protein
MSGMSIESNHFFRQPEKFIKAADIIIDNEWLKHVMFKLDNQ